MARKRGTAAEADTPISSSVSTTCTVYKGSNLESQNYTNWSAPVESYLTTSPDGYLMRVQSGAIDGKILIEYYDSGYNLKKTMTLDLPLPVSSLSLKSSAKGQATASWKQVKSITSYQVQYSTASSMKSAKTITVKDASKSAVLKKLTRGKKYYVRIRTVKTVSKKNYYSTWSKTASVKVK